MNESEKILIEMIQAAERGESPEAVFKKRLTKVQSQQRVKAAFFIDKTRQAVVK